MDSCGGGITGEIPLHLLLSFPQHPAHGTTPLRDHCPSTTAGSFESLFIICGIYRRNQSAEEDNLGNAWERTLAVVPQ